MRSARLLSASAWLVPLAGGLLLVSMATGLDLPPRPAAPPPAPGSNVTNSSAAPPPRRAPPPRLIADGLVAQRALYVLIGFTLTGVFYLLVRAVRTKRPPQMKYGLLREAVDGVELEALESEEDETLYEARGPRR